MKSVKIIMMLLICVVIFSCKQQSTYSSRLVDHFYTEPDDDTTYRNATYQFFYNRNGQLCEKKHAFAGPADSACHCEFLGYFDCTITVKIGDSLIQRPLADFIDVPTYRESDTSRYSTDKHHVYFFDLTLDGGKRYVVNDADPATFRKLYEYRWGIDKSNVFFKYSMLKGLDVTHMQLLYPASDATPFLWYLKDNQRVFFEDKPVVGADAASFKLVSNLPWDAEDKNYKYDVGKRWLENQ